MPACICMCTQSKCDGRIFMLLTCIEVKVTIDKIDTMTASGRRLLAATIRVETRSLCLCLDLVLSVERLQARREKKQGKRSVKKPFWLY